MPLNLQRQIRVHDEIDAGPGARFSAANNVRRAAALCERPSEQGAIVKQAVFEEGEEREWLHIGLAMAWAAEGGRAGRQAAGRQAGMHLSFLR